MNIDFRPLIALAFFGWFAATAALGGLAGLLIALPICLWQHDFSQMPTFAAGGASAGLVLGGWPFLSGFLQIHR